MFKDILENINYIEGLYVYGSGELDQLSPINENIEEEEKKIYESPFPRKVPLHFISQTETIKLIKCGINTTIILSTEGNVYSFGSADNGALGHKESINALRIPLKFEATGISGGDCHGIAYNRENLAFWGQFRNSKKSLGKPYYDPTYFNKTHIKGEFFKKAISGINHVVILSENKNVFCFGSNEFGQIGVSPDKQIHHFQINKLYEKDVEDIFTGHEHSFLTKYEGGVKILKGWGNNGNGQLGTGSFVTRLNENYIIYVPTKVIFPGISKISVKKIEGGSSSTICLTEDNRIFIWGENDFSELGLQIKDKIIPRPKELLFFNPYSNPNNAIDDIYANNQYFYAKNSMTNKVYSWGIGINYQLGNRKMKDENTPYLINHLFFKNLYINKLSLGYSHVAVFLTEKKNMPLNNNMSQKKSNEKSKKKISENKVIKRKNDELPGSKKEKEIDDYSTLTKVKEEYITLNDSDQPKISVKKSLTEKKIKKGNYCYDNINIEQDEKDESKQNGNIKSKESKSNIVFEKNIKNESKKINGNIIKSPNKKNANSINLQREKKMNSTKKDKLYDDIDINGKIINKNEEKINEKSSSKCDKRRRYPYKNDESEKKVKKENEEKEKKIQSKSKRRQNSAKKEEEKKDEKNETKKEDKDKEKIKEKAQLKNKNRKSDKQEEEKSDKKEKKSLKSELSNRHKISLSKEKMEEKKSRKSSGSKSNKKEEEQYYKSGNKDENENIDKIKDEKKGKKNSSSSNKNKKLKNEMVDGKEDEDNNENSDNHRQKKYSYPKNIKNSEKKEVLKGRSKAKNSREKSKKKSKSKSKDKYPKRK